jgi:hypothetical protein
MVNGPYAKYDARKFFHSLSSLLNLHIVGLMDVQSYSCNTKLAPGAIPSLKFNDNKDLLESNFENILIEPLSVPEIRNLLNRPKLVTALIDEKIELTPDAVNFVNIITEPLNATEEDLLSKPEPVPASADEKIKLAPDAADEVISIAKLMDDDFLDKSVQLIKSLYYSLPEKPETITKNMVKEYAKSHPELFIKLAKE